MEPRSASVELIYEGVDISRDIDPYLKSLSFADNGTGKADDLQITLEDREGRWINPWMPEKGDRVQANILVQHWEHEGDSRKLPCGTFSVDTANLKGPPDTVAIKASSIPAHSAARNERKTRAWEKIKLSAIAQDIATKAGLQLMYEAEYDPQYDRVDQTQQSDLSFLAAIAGREGIATKVTGETIVLFDEYLYEQKPTVRTIRRGESDILKYAFERSTVDVAYSACTVEYYDSSKKLTYSHTYKPPNASPGPVLKVNTRVSSNAEAAHLARKLLREKNKNETVCRMTMKGDVALVQGVTIDIAGFGKFDDKYIIVTATHRVANGYTVDFEARKVLGY